MEIRITTFSISLIILMLLSLTMIFAKYYIDSRDKTSEIIINTIDTSITELGFIVSKNVKSSHQSHRVTIKQSRPILDRMVATNTYIDAATIFHNGEPIIYTNYKLKSLPIRSLGVGNHDDDTNHYEYIIGTNSILSSIFAYHKGKRYEYILVYYFDEEQIISTFETDLKEYLVMIVVIPLLILLFISFVVMKLILTPLKTLNTYAYHQSERPKDFNIIEIDELKDSIVETIERLESEKTDLYNLARTDTLSGISNRNAMEEFVEKLIKTSERSETEFALLFLDLDNFKNINDSLGHDIGDLLLKNIAYKISDSLRPNDTIARIGGDEFILVLTDYQTKFELTDAIRRIESLISENNTLGGYDVKVTSSIGISLFPKDATTLLGLMKHADIALYRSKDNGKNQHSFYTTSIDNEMQEFLTLTNEMKTALDNNEYELYYQPQNDITTNKIVGAEALLRWKHSTKGYIPPYKFIPLAEQSGFIVELGEWILEDAIAQKEKMEAEGIDIKISINVAAKQIVDDNFLVVLNRILNDYNVNRENIALEITEYIFINNNTKVLEVFQEIKKLGLKLYLDDFGTGYSSLSYLKKFPIDVVKIDKSFIDDYDQEDGAIFIETIIRMAKTLKLAVVAEGVEKSEQLEFLRTLGCEIFQGYLASKPKPIDEFKKMITICNSSFKCSECESQCGLYKES